MLTGNRNPIDNSFTFYISSEHKQDKKLLQAVYKNGYIW